VDGSIRPPHSERQNGAEIADLIMLRGLCLARVSRPDVAANMRQLSGYRQYIKDHADEERRYSIWQPLTRASSSGDCGPGSCEPGPLSALPLNPKASVGAPNPKGVEGRRHAFMP
jgi:hypothetical protein